MHHHWWDPFNPETAGAEDFTQWADSRNLLLLNESDEDSANLGTFFRPNLTRPSVLDLTFATPNLADKVDDWEQIPCQAKI